MTDEPMRVSSLLPQLREIAHSMNNLLGGVLMAYEPLQPMLLEATRGNAEARAVVEDWDDMLRAVVVMVKRLRRLYAPIIAARPELDAPIPHRDPRETRVLVVDDEVSFRKAIVMALRKQGYQVVACTGGRQALNRITSGKKFDAIVCDVTMPRISGPDLHRRVGEVAPEMLRRFGFLTGGATQWVDHQYLMRSNALVASKPIGMATLRAFVDALAAEASEGAARGGDRARRSRSRDPQRGAGGRGARRGGRSPRGTSPRSDRRRSRAT